MGRKFYRFSSVALEAFWGGILERAAIRGLHSPGMWSMFTVNRYPLSLLSEAGYFPIYEVCKYYNIQVAIVIIMTMEEEKEKKISSNARQSYTFGHSCQPPQSSPLPSKITAQNSSKIYRFADILGHVA